MTGDPPRPAAHGYRGPEAIYNWVTPSTVIDLSIGTVQQNCSSFIFTPVCVILDDSQTGADAWVDVCVCEERDRVPHFLFSKLFSEMYKFFRCVCIYSWFGDSELLH